MLSFNPITVDNYVAFLIARRWVGHQDLLWPRLEAINFSWLWSEPLVYCLAYQGSTYFFSDVVWLSRDLQSPDSIRKPASNFILLIVPMRYFCCGSNCFMLGVDFYVVCTLCTFSIDAFS